MRLINAHTHELVEFFDADIPPYAILSHKVRISMDKRVTRTTWLATSTLTWRPRHRFTYIRLSLRHLLTLLLIAFSGVLRMMSFLIRIMLTNARAIGLGLRRFKISVAWREN
jgi:hypothetical protein